MNITIVGPRSVGKSITAKILAEKLDFKYLETDSLMDEILKNEGGLDKVIKSRDVDSMMIKGAELVKDIFAKGNNIVLDLAGGAISSKKGYELGVCQKIIKIIKDKTIVVGLLPFEKDKKSIDFLYEREKERKHFKGMNESDLYEQTKKDYLKLKPRLEEIAQFIVYVGEKTSKSIVDEIISKIE